MTNYFEIFADKLDALEKGQKQICDLLAKHSPVTEFNPYGDFKWLCNTCSGVPASTLRIKSASGEIPGVVKLGKRVLYEKALVINWIGLQARPPISSGDALERTVDEQIDHQLAKKGGLK